MEKTNKLLEFQKRVGSILKEATNPFYKSKYFDINGLIESIKPILNELNLTLTQPISIGGIDGNKNILNTFLKDGGTVIESSSIILPENIDPQKLGSAITYFRRYSIQSMLLLQAEDDDGSLGKKPKKNRNLKNTEKI
ncbi:MAG: ERF family protein [Ignavibacteria bacterium]|nr:ERF family protein [Ignavibacteria bacterium]